MESITLQLLHIIILVLHFDLDVYDVVKFYSATFSWKILTRS